MSRNRRNRYVGRWEEVPPPPIELPFIFENISFVLRCGLTPGEPYTHHQIADWTRRYWVGHMNAEDSAAYGIGEYPDERGLDVIEEVDAQWGLYLFNTYSFEELPSVDLSAIELPTEWFEQWLERLQTATA